MATARQNKNTSTTNGRRGSRTLDVPTLEGWLWDAACVIREPLDAPNFKDYILPLIFLKRLSDVFDEVRHMAHEFGDDETALKLVEQGRKLVRFFVPKKARWAKIAEKTAGVREYVTDAVRIVAKANPQLSGVVRWLTCTTPLVYVQSHWIDAEPPCFGFPLSRPLQPRLLAFVRRIRKLFHPRGRRLPDDVLAQSHAAVKSFKGITTARFDARRRQQVH